MTDLAIYINGATAVAVLGLVARGAWQVAQREKRLREDFRQEVSRLEQDARDRGDTYRNEFGETCAAIRQKIHDFEVFSRDHFVSKDSFEAVVGRIERSFEKMTERLEGKLEKAVEIFHQRPD